MDRLLSVGRVFGEYGRREKLNRSWQLAQSDRPLCQVTNFIFTVFTSIETLENDFATATRLQNHSRVLPTS